ncbi:hypothetical protein DRO54_02440 [Candidatus Bathyarchaeota archaeon]|nr:MAG: hypothetical protein DRO54_02440 [Candidatus Bathyarchaeota archaeon]
MGERLKVLLFVAILGFVGGIIADFTAIYVAPVLIKLFPEIFRARWVLSGIAGSVIMLIIVTIWAYITEPGMET